jgi:hypothetical protein
MLCNDIMSINYQLVNPYVGGEFKKIFNGSSPLKAAQHAWDNLSKYFSSHVPKLHFTLETVKDRKMHHFLVKEGVNGNKIDYSLTEVKKKPKNKNLNRFTNKLRKLQGGAKDSLNGGKKHSHLKEDESSSSSSSTSDSSDYYTRARTKYSYLEQPIIYWWYDPSLYDVDRFFVPSFIPPLTPIIEVQYPSVIMVP